MTRYALIMVAVLLASGPAGAQDRASEALDAAGARWSAAGITDYRYSYRKYCECYSGEPPEVVVTVTGGRVTDAFSRDQYSDREVPAGDDRLDLYYTIDELLAKLAAAGARGSRVEAEFDPALGYPMRLLIDDFPEFTGDETDLRLTGFETL